MLWILSIRFSVIAYVPFDPIVKKAESTVREDGVECKTTKGAPHVILKVANVLSEAETTKLCHEVCG